MTSGGAPPAGTAVLLEASRAVYIEVPKVACSSIKILLAGWLGTDLTAVGGDPHRAQFPEPGPCQAGPKLYPSLFSFAFVRNPWDRLVSCYRDKVLGEAPDFTTFHLQRGVAYCLARFDAFQPGMSFVEFVEAVTKIPDGEADEHFRSQYTFLSNRDGKIAIDFVGRFETLHRDWDAVCRQLGFPSTELPHVQAARRRVDYAKYYDSNTRTAVTRRYAEDVRLFGYTFGK